LLAGSENVLNDLELRQKRPGPVLLCENLPHGYILRVRRVEAKG
jgi:hypothetical protein